MPRPTQDCDWTARSLHVSKAVCLHVEVLALADTQGTMQVEEEVQLLDDDSQAVLALLGSGPEVDNLPLPAPLPAPRFPAPAPSLAGVRNPP